MTLCKTCNNNYMEETCFCTGCGDGGCPSCFAGSPALCVPCGTNPKTPEEPTFGSTSPASTVNSQENGEAASIKVD